jgi:hypothetical protein
VQLNAQLVVVVLISVDSLAQEFLNFFEEEHGLVREAILR